ncbi:MULTISPECIES: pyridoxamine 5'-phosphate oxidase family protein [Niastella]|uniref:Pyridoxamine 5'-phosphate oxidase family protein n=1 Tax=Niastella soli TaxID=2821487 RepID=A0ABS3Z2H1_9BACT|nr:pyridoxamine 5'-phosphate oxidase family protein [Niastella soli]MBO9203952.1 pyridoxamine 5'-phosphate oxidase family protein [Niastella soli]
MDSINKQQKEKNREDLNNEAAVKKLRELIDKTKTCFFDTGHATNETSGVRPMAVQQIDDAGNLWFLSAKDSHKNQDITLNCTVKLFFQGSAHSDFMYITGKAEIVNDRNKIDELWEPIMKTWFTEGKDDPRISVIKFIPQDGYYWDTKHGKAIAFLKMMTGAATGKTMDDSIEGKLNM